MNLSEGGKRKFPHVYLAGSIYQNDWRHSLVSDLRSANATDNGLLRKWPAMLVETKIGGEAFSWNYCGPYVASCDHGCAHGPGTHGTNRTMCHPDDYEQKTRGWVHAHCLEAIRDCDIFFAWLGNSKTPCTAYGTLVEIGYAAAQGKQLVIAGECVARHCTCESDELWFSRQFPDALVVGAPDPIHAFHQAIHRLRQDHGGINFFF
ncbi:nucleoside 2-deoxyribosyltransferase [Nocardia altamirensis]|uniref:nucleoside 2-deoxyribosyltransferase n=1 Tax=Nocardia altamirensis TaxID=472158 RepID=UPI0014355A8C|nr:nucleoside 2-deoxyribosyltransferase [Nocardia altamirensis]